PPHPRSTLFPYTTLFRSEHIIAGYRHRETALGELHLIVAQPAVAERRRRAGEIEGPHAVKGLVVQRDDLVLRRDGAVVPMIERPDRKSTRLNSSHVEISY